MYIGKKLKELRKQKKIKLIDLATKSGVQIATLSRIENLKMTGTLESHMKIAEALDVDVTYLYSDIITQEEQDYTLSEENKTDVYVHNAGSSYEILTTRLMSRKMMPIMLSINVKSKTNIEQGRPGTERFIYVLEGKLEIETDDGPFILDEGHTLHFDGSKKHCFVNKAKKTVKALIVSSPILL
jgi:transcriptional regulator with XRE-family HTH domain